LPFEEGVAMKNTLAVTWEKWDRSSVARSAGPQDLSPRRLLVGAGLQVLSTRWLLGAALAGELATAIYLFASGSVSPVLVRSLQLFLRF
jgi:hypothetical protein